MARSTLIIFIALLLAVFTGGFLRFYRLSSAPPSVNWDEASYGYNAYSLWKTGADEYGTALPWSIRSFDDYKPPLYAYLTAPIVGIFGLDEFHTRFVSAVFGTLAVILTFILSARLTRRLSLALISAWVVATTPALVHYSRLAFEAVPALTLLLISWTYLLKAKTRWANYFWALLFAALSFFSYNSHKIYFAFVALYIAWHLRSSWYRHLKLLVGLFLICLPIAYSVIFSNSLARFSSTSVFPLYSNTHSLYLFTGELFNRYFSYYSPANIFVRGTNEPNQKIKTFSVFYPFQFVFFLIGAGYLLKSHRRFKFFLLWWLLGPIPAALTWSWFTPIRVLPHWWTTAFVIAVGLWWSWTHLQTRLFRFLSTAAVFSWWTLNTAWLLLYLVWYMPYTDYGLWQWGFREAIQAIAPYQNTYPHIVWESPHAQPHIFILFYSKYDPAKYQAELPADYKIPSMRKKFDFGKYEFRKIFWPDDRAATSSRTLFVGGVYSLPSQDISPPWAILKDVIDPAGYTNFRIVAAP